MKNSFKHRMDTTLSDLSWRKADTQETLGMMKGEIHVKKRITFGMAVAMALLLATMAFAVAEIIRFSVKDYQKLEGEAQQHITTIGQDMKTKDVTIHLTDAVFNGQELYVTFEAEPVSGEPVYLVPFLTASSEGNALQPHVFGSRGMEFHRGFWVPEKIDSGTQGKYAFDVRLNQAVHEPVEWELRFAELKPLWPTVEDTSGYSDDSDNSIDYEVWEKQFATAYQNKQIMLVHGNSIMMFEELLPEGDDLAKRLVASGAFEENGQLKAAWTSPKVETLTHLAGQTIQEDGFHVAVDKLDVSFMSIDYRFTVTVTDEAKGLSLIKEDGFPIFYDITAEGTQLRYVETEEKVSKDTNSVTYSGVVNYSGEAPASVQLKPYVYNQEGNKDYLDHGAFSINIR